MKLYGCLSVPDFPVAAILRGERNLKTPPVIVFSGTAPNCFVYAVNEPARIGGIREGMPLVEATARFAAAQTARSSQPTKPFKDEGKGRGIRPYRLRPVAPVVVAENTTVGGTAAANGITARNNRTLQIRPRDPEAEKQTQQELMELALMVSPRVEDAAPGLIVLDLAGLPDPHGSANRLCQGAEKLGLDANVAVSRNRFVALCGARTRPGVTHIFPGQEAGFLSVLPVEVLPLEEREKETLVRWGIRTVGELARLPEDSLVARFGTRGAHLLKLAHGRDDSVLRPHEPAPAFAEGVDLDWQIGELEPLSFLLSGLLERLCLKLQGHNLAAEEIRVSLRLADSSRFERTVSLSYPLADPRVLLTLVRLDLAAHPPGEAIEGVSVSAQPTPRRRVQFSLFEPALPSPEKLAVTLARLSNLVGKKRVGAPVVADTHRPGAFAVRVFSVQEKGQGRRNKKRLLGGGSQISGGKPNRDRQGAIAHKSKVADGGRQETNDNSLSTAHISRLTVHDKHSDTGQGESGIKHWMSQVRQPDELVGTQHTAPETPFQSPAGTDPFACLFTDVGARHAVPDPARFAKERQVTHQDHETIQGTRRPITINSGLRIVPVKEQSTGLTSHAGTACRAPTELSSDLTAQRYNSSRFTVHENSRLTAHGSRESPVQRLNESTRRSLAFRCFRPPPEAEVILRGKLPVYVNAGDIRGAVRTRAGPWRVCGEWWTPNGWDYEEWDVEVNGRLYRICCELSSQAWHVTGTYD